MLRLSIVWMVLFFVGCSGNEAKVEQAATEMDYGQFEGLFKKATLPFTLTDTTLLANKDTSSIKVTNFGAYIPDSIKSNLFGKGAKIKYVPLYSLSVSNAEQYFIVKAESKAKKAALLLVYTDSHEPSAVFPFLVPDNDPSTFQQTSIDKAYSISRSITQKKDDAVADGKDVFVYNKEAKAFTLIMTDPLNDQSGELVNPIDTLSRRHKLAGDYVKSKRNIVSVRDGRKPNLLTVFVHIETEADCNGEIKGDAEITGENTAIYRPAGDPCVLLLTFGTNSVKIAEQEGCGSHRGLECLFEGSFTRKKADTLKTEKKAKTKTKA